MGEARRADLEPVRLVGTVADEVDAELALRVLDGGIGLALGHAEAFGEELEVVDQLFHVRLHRLARRRCHLVVVGDDGAGVGTQPVHALLDDAVGLAHLLHTHEVAVVAVARLAHGDVEFHAVVGVVGLLLAQVPGDARAAQHRAGHAEVQRALLRHDADVHGALLPDAVVRQQRLVLVHALGEALREVVDEVQQRAAAVLVQHLDRLGVAHLARLVLRHAVGQVAIDAARTEVGRVHACTRHRLVHVEQVLALAERVDQDGGAAAIVSVRAEPHQVVQQARDLGEHHADVLRAQRHVDAQQLLDGQAVGVLVAHHRDVVQPVHVGQRLDEGLVLGQLLGGAVQQADMGVGALHDFAVELEHQAQHAVRGRVLRTKVQGVVLDFSHRGSPECARSASVQASVLFFADDAGRDLARLDRHRLVHHAARLGVVAHLDVARQREILAEGMADEAVVGQDAAQVVMAIEHDAIEVEGLALVPVGGVPDAGHRRHHGEVVVGAEHLHAHALVEADGQQVRHHGVARAFRAHVAIGGVVDAAEVHELLEPAAGRIAQQLHRGQVVGGRDGHREFVERDHDVARLVAERSGDRVPQSLGSDGNGCHAGEPFRRGRWYGCGGSSAGAG